RPSASSAARRCSWASLRISGTLVAPPRRVHVPEGNTRSPSSGGVLGIEVDPDREELGADGSDHEPVHPAADPLEACSGVVVQEHGGGAAAPAAADLHTHARIGFQVADVPGAASVLSDDPERVTVQAVADGVLPRPARSPTG